MPQDSILVNQLKKIGIMGSSHSKFSARETYLLNRAMEAAKLKIEEKSKTLGALKNGWMMVTTKIGHYGDDYLTRAAVAFVGLGANLSQDAIYPIAYLDANNQRLNGKFNYILHFDKKDLPPVNAFWSISLYDSRGFFVENIINRHSIGDRDNLKFNPDASLDIYIQHQSPGKNKESNWLPAPLDYFNVTLRLYWPKKNALDGTWNIPAIHRQNASRALIRKSLIKTPFHVSAAKAIEIFPL